MTSISLFSQPDFDLHETTVDLPYMVMGPSLQGARRSFSSKFPIQHTAGVFGPPSANSCDARNDVMDVSAAASFFSRTI